MSQGKTRFAGLSGVTAALLASVCCIGPVVAAAVGLGSLGFAAALEPLRPLFIGVTVLALGAGFYQAYKRQAACEDGSCSEPKSRKGLRAMMWVSTVIAVVALGFPYYSGSLMGGTAQAQAPAPEANEVALAVCTMKVTGMTCAGCESHIIKALGGLGGVRHTTASSKDGTATVTYDESVAKPETFPKTLEDEIGYEAEACLKDADNKDTDTPEEG